MPHPTLTAAAIGSEMPSELGAHSLRKSSTTYVSGQPSVLSSTSICIRGGWSIGGVKDVYMTHNAEPEKAAALSTLAISES
jgi:hypothetical protein